MIMGANIGTTITAQIVALESFDFSKFAVALAFIGMFMEMLCKKEKHRTVGLSFAGLGLVFLALQFMSSSMKIFRDAPAVTNLLTSINNPFLLLFIGVVFTALVQSSSAVTTIIISMVSAGLTIGSSPNSVLFLILGTNVGTCVTALISSIGASTNAKRTSIIHLLFNLFGTLVFLIVLLLWKDFADVTLKKWFSHESTQIAMFHTIFNVISTLIFLPFINLFIKLSTIFVKDKKEDVRVTYLDDRFLNTPSIAVMQATREVIALGKEAMNALDLSLVGFLERNLDDSKKVFKHIDNVEEYNKEIIAYLVNISSKEISIHDENKVSALHTVVNDLIRESEIADNVVKYTRFVIEKDIDFSEHVYQSIGELRTLLSEQFVNVEKFLIDKDYTVLDKVVEIEEKIDNMRTDLIDGHIKRLEEGKCKPQSSGVFINLISNLERAGDHLNYIVDVWSNKGK
jgi:phosphate:Na+ symporter